MWGKGQIIGIAELRDAINALNSRVKWTEHEAERHAKYRDTIISNGLSQGASDFDVEGIEVYGICRMDHERTRFFYLRDGKELQHTIMSTDEQHSKFVARLTAKIDLGNLHDEGKRQGRQ